MSYPVNPSLFEKKAVTVTQTWKKQVKEVYKPVI